MPPRAPPRATSAAANKDEEEDDDDHSDHADSVHGGEAGGKDKSASQIRKAQNRVAQREFRQRKQQYIRDLEARLEVLSGDKEERVELVMLLVRNLMKENKDLRGMIKQMAGFIGEGIGSCLPRLGLSAQQLDAVLNRADTDTAYEAFVKLRASRELEEANPGIGMGEIKRKPTSAKRKREANTAGASGSRPPDSAHEASASHTPDVQPPTKSSRQDEPDSMTNFAETYSYLFPDSETPDWSRYAPPQQGGNAPNFQGSPLQMRDNNDPGAAQQYQQYNQEQAARGMFGMPMQMYSPQMSMWGPFGAMSGDLSGFGLTVPPGQALPPSMSSLAGPVALPTQQTDYAAQHPAAAAVTGPSGPSGIRPSATPDISLRDQQRLKQAVTLMVQSKGITDGPTMSAGEIEERMRAQRAVVESFKEDERLRKRIEPMQVIAYHINNFRVNHAYVLPASMRPTAVQRTIPHEHAIDGIPFPSIRDRMILLRGRYDLVEAYQGMLLEMTLRADDPMDHRNWEFSEKWLHEFPILADEEVYIVSNRWRAERGEPPLVRPEVKA